TYHSIALLLKDGRIMAGGGGLCGGCPINHFDVEILTPPYLLNADGSPAQRPVFMSTPIDSIGLGQQLRVSMNTSGSHDFVLVRTSVVTHSINNDQRRIPLDLIRQRGREFTLAIPANASVLQPGNYYLFAINDSGVPSVADTVRVRPNTEEGTLVRLLDHHANYVTANRSGRMSAQFNPLASDDQFTLVRNNGTVSLLSSYGKFVSAQPSGQLQANRDWILSWERFSESNNNNGTVSFRSAFNRFIVSQPNGSVLADRTIASIWEQFDLVPIPDSERAIYLTLSDIWNHYFEVTADARLISKNEVATNNAVFKLVDVGAGKLALQSIVTGHYVSAQPSGKLEVNRTAVGPWEQFGLIRNNDGTIALESHFGRYVSAQPNGSVVADRTWIQPWEKLRLSFD
ncbi:MAG: galactose oxidase-like domain-containing protein, partial [Pseudomonadota bacterium]